MTINVKNENEVYFNDIGEGECFAYNGAYYILACDEDRDDYFGVNLADGRTKFIPNDAKVTALTATVSFKELS